MAAISRSDYRHFLLMDASDYRYISTLSWQPGTSWEKSVYSGTARFPVGTSFQSESAQLRTEGPIDRSALVYLFASIFPHRLVSGKWEFYWDEGEAGTPAGYLPPAQYHKYLMYSRRAQCYEVESPIINNMTLTMRRQGESTLTADWIGKTFSPISTPASVPTPNPVSTERIIDNTEWGVKYAKYTTHAVDPNDLADLNNVMEAEIMFPNLVEPLYTFNTSGFAWEDVAFRQTEPTIKLTMHADTAWVPLYDRTGTFLIEINAGTDFVFRVRGQANSDVEVLQLAGDIQQSSMSFVPIATWDPGAADPWTSSRYGQVEIDDSGVATLVSNVPGAPTGLTVGTETATTIPLTWTAPDDGGSAITGYDVRYKLRTASVYTDGPQGVTTLSATISGLTSGNQYHVSVRATNAVGDGPWTADVEAETA